MRRARILLVAFLAVFAAAAAAGAVQASAMAIGMSLTAPDKADMGGCNDCGEDQSVSAPCDAVCVPALTFTVPTGEAPAVFSTARAYAPRGLPPPGRTVAPDPFPPKPLS